MLCQQSVKIYKVDKILVQVVAKIVRFDRKSILDEQIS